MLSQSSLSLTSPAKQQGAAIIVALFVVALVAAAAVIMIERLRTDIRRTELVTNFSAAYQYAQGSVLWATTQLNNNLKQQQPNKVTDRTPIKSVDKHDGFQIASTITDAQSLFNLNNLSDPQYVTNFTQLIRAVLPEMETSDVQSLVESVKDWVAPAGNAVLDEYYLKQNPAYRPAHRLMTSVSELRLVKGVTPEVFNKLAPFITVLPVVTAISVNNAPPPVFMSVSSAMTFDAAKALAAVCARTPFGDINAFNNQDIVKNTALETGKITVTSNYFLLRTDVTLGKTRLTLYTLLERYGQGDQSNTIVLWQSIGTL